MQRRTARGVRRTAVGVLAALAAASLSATLERAAAVPGGGTVVGPAAGRPGVRPALTPIGTPAKAPVTVKDHGLLVCPPPANYDPDSTAP